MTDDHDSGSQPADPIDEQAAHIHVRAEEAPEEIAELIDNARDLGRDAPAEVDPDAGNEP